MRLAARAEQANRVFRNQEDSDEVCILLFAADPLASQVASALHFELGVRVSVVETQVLCTEALQRRAFDLLLLEESVLALNPLTAEAVYEAAGTAVVVEVNFGLMQTERILAATRCALRRRRLDLQQARAAAKTGLKSELIASLTGLLLEAQLALRQASPGHTPALERLVGLAECVCAQLSADDHRSL